MALTEFEIVMPKAEFAALVIEHEDDLHDQTCCPIDPADWTVKYLGVKHLGGNRDDGMIRVTLTRKADAETEEEPF